MTASIKSIKAVSHKIKKILIWKVNCLGDAVVFLPSLHAIREQFPDSRIVLVATPVTRDVIEGSVDLDDIWVIEREQLRLKRFTKNYKPFINLLKRIYLERFDISISPYGEYYSGIALISMLCKIPRRISYWNPAVNLNRLYTDFIYCDENINVIENEFQIVKYLTGNDDLKPVSIPINYGRSDRDHVENIISLQGINVSEPYVVIHPGSKYSYREWGINKYSELAERIIRDIGIHVVMVQENGNKDRYPDGVFHADSLSVKQLAYLTEKASLFIGNNSGPLHVASVMGTPYISVNGPTAKMWYIYWKNIVSEQIVKDRIPCVPCETWKEMPARCLNINRPNECMNSISVNEVFDKTKEILIDIRHRVEPISIVSKHARVP